MTNGGLRRFALVALWAVAAICVLEQVRTGSDPGKTAAALYVMGLSVIVWRQKRD